MEVMRMAAAMQRWTAWRMWIVMVHWPVIPWMYGMRMHMRRTVAVIGIKRGPAVIQRSPRAHG